MSEKILASIEQDYCQGHAVLFWRANPNREDNIGSIWCRSVLTDNEWDTETPCTEDNAIDTIKIAWRGRFNLRFPEENK